MQLREGSELQNGKYRILRVLGQGGFGITYLAENTFFEKKVAIKEFFPKDFCGRDNTSHLTLGTQNNADTVAKLKYRFLKEAKNIAKLDHPGIVKIHDIFEENNTAYYVMDYIEGENLNEMVKRNGPLSEEKAVEYLRKVGDALEYIHSRNMTHFDVKPANIMVRRSDDQPILIDFGLSKQYDMHGDATSTLMQGVSHGYSPIELYNPGSLSSFSPQTDIYSLGATLYFLLTGSVPPSASDALENGITIPSTISEANATAIQNAMAVSRGKRPRTMSNFIENLSIQNTNENLSYDLSTEDEDATVFIHMNRHSNSGASATTILQPKELTVRSPTQKVNVIIAIGGLLLLIIFLFIGVNTCSTGSVNSNGVITEDSIMSEVHDMSWNSPLGRASYTGEIVVVGRVGIPYGKGIAKIIEGQNKGCVYEGDFVNGQMDGHALDTVSNGDIFEGSFKKNKYGYGTYTIKATGEYFTGSFDSNGQPEYGQWYDRSGNRIE